MFHAISPIQEKRNKKSKAACCEQVFGWFLTADECPRYGGWCVAALEAEGPEKEPQPQPQSRATSTNLFWSVNPNPKQPTSTNIKQFVLFCGFALS